MRKVIASNVELRELKGKIKASEFGSQEKFAPVIPMTVSTLSLKLNGKSDFSSTEICRICTLLNISKEEMGPIFFPSMFPKETLSA